VFLIAGDSGKRAVSTVSWKPLWRVLGTPPRTAADAELWRRTAHLIVTCTEEEETPDENILESFVLIGRCLGHFIASSTPLSKVWHIKVFINEFIFVS